MLQFTNRKLFQIHAWLGLITGVFLLFLGFTGSILVFREELNQLLYDPLIESNTTEKPASIDSIYRVLAHRYEHIRGIAMMSNPLERNHSYEFRVYTSDDKLYTIDLVGVIIDPHTGKILKEGYYRQFSLFPINWILSFHYSFMLGNPGMFITAVFGLTMLVSILTGLIVYRKNLWKVLTFRIAIKKKNWRTISSDLHRIVGVWALVLNIIIFFTGFWLNRFMFESSGWKIKPAVQTPVLIPFSADEKLRQAYELIPGLQPGYVFLPVKKEDAFTIYGSTKADSKFYHSAYTIHFSAADGSLTSVERPSDIKGIGQWFEAAHYSLHIGSFGGITTRILYVIIGLTPGLLSVTGFLLWWRRKRKSIIAPPQLIQSLKQSTL